MNRTTNSLAAFVLVACGVCFAGPPRPSMPDLRIKEFRFPPGSEKALKVRIANYGDTDAGTCVLRLTVRKIKGVAVGRQTDVTVPVIAPKKAEWVLIDCSSILPNDVALKTTTFKLNIDATNVVAESIESNNEKWHNL